jgi:hypothetical protein
MIKFACVSGWLLCVSKIIKELKCPTTMMGYLCYNFSWYKIFLLATYPVVLLHCMICGKMLVGWSPGFLGHLAIKWSFSPASFHFSITTHSKSFGTFAWCACIRWLGAVCHSDGLLQLLNLVFHSFTIFCFKHFLPILQSHSYGILIEIWNVCWLLVHVVQVKIHQRWDL